ncbi:amidohydrolase [Microbacterium sp. G2-8]|uniref:amidohydrolase n=1 Tax=Microbacterium sp. G2-8 TaxID=2842454 RepID=UPI001C8AA761|nr:amidohydrolase [Microbacterium sp. G2-8]
MSTTPSSLLVTGAKIWTQDPALPWASALAVVDGTIVSVGDESDVVRALDGEYAVEDAGGRFVMPALADGHVHLGLGGTQAAHELPVLPNDSVDDVLAKVRDWASTLPAGAWVVGGIIGSGVTDTVAADAGFLRALDDASLGHPVMLRDDTMHNRWVSSLALARMGVGADTADPEGGEYVRDRSGALTGVLYELACAPAEDLCAESIADPAAHKREAMLAAQRILHGYGITSAHEAATMSAAWEALSDLDRAGEWTLRVVGSGPTRQFLEHGVVGDELMADLGRYRSDLLRADFVKVVADGVPMTRTSAMLRPYVCHHEGEDESFAGEPYWSVDDLTQELEKQHARGIGAKCHATGDASLRVILDAAENLRTAHPDEPRQTVQIAHASVIDADDIPRFAQHDVIADVSPALWYPSVMVESIRAQIGDERANRFFPLRDLVDGGALVSAGSDWPCALPTPDPWIGLETMITRRDPSGQYPGTLGDGQELTLEEALAAFTVNPAVAMGIADVGRLQPGYAADFVVLDRDLFAIDPREIHDTQVVRTYASGRLVFER